MCWLEAALLLCGPLKAGGLLCAREVIFFPSSALLFRVNSFKTGQFTMFQNTTDHFRIETGLIFQLAAITGKGKAECLRERPPSSQVPKHVVRC